MDAAGVSPRTRHTVDRAQHARPTSAHTQHQEELDNALNIEGAETRSNMCSIVDLSRVAHSRAPPAHPRATRQSRISKPRCVELRWLVFVSFVTFVNFVTVVAKR
jgi:hypothetical protein